MAEQAQRAADTGNSATLYKINKQLAKTGFNAKKPIKDENGKLMSNEGERLIKWKEHFQRVLNTSIEDGNEETEFEERNQIRINVEPPTKIEIINAIKGIKKRKTPWIDGLPGEIVKTNPTNTEKVLLPLFNRIWKEKKMPGKWKKGINIKIPKKGDLAKCENYRGITLLPVISKVFEPIFFFLFLFYFFITRLHEYSSV